MKNSLWIVVVLVVGIVGFLVGYSVSPPAGGAVAAKGKGNGAAQHAGSAPGYAPQPAAAAAATPGYGANTADAKPAAGGYR